MGNSYLNRGIICVLVGICFILAAVFTESALDGLLWGLAGGSKCRAIQRETGAEEH